LKCFDVEGKKYGRPATSGYYIMSSEEKVMLTRKKKPLGNDDGRMNGIEKVVVLTLASEGMDWLFVRSCEPTKDSMHD
jgi:hypothetical protein